MKRPGKMLTFGKEPKQNKTTLHITYMKKQCQWFKDNILPTSEMNVERQFLTEHGLDFRQKTA